MGSEERVMNSYGRRHTLTLTNLAVTDFGNYSCMADNSLGRGWGFLYISGKPEQPVLLSPPRGEHPNRYSLVWDTVSLLRVVEYRILYRLHNPKNKSGEWTSLISPSDTRRQRLRY